MCLQLSPCSHLLSLFRVLFQLHSHHSHTWHLQLRLHRHLGRLWDHQYPQLHLRRVLLQGLLLRLRCHPSRTRTVPLVIRRHGLFLLLLRQPLFHQNHNRLRHPWFCHLCHHQWFANRSRFFDFEAEAIDICVEKIRLCLVREQETVRGHRRNAALRVHLLGHCVFLV